MQSMLRWNEFLPSGVALTTILALTTFTNSTVAQNAAATHGDVQSNTSLTAAAASTPTLDAEARSRMSALYGKLPISFEVNQGQTDGSVQFLARGAGYTLFLTPGEAVLSLHAVDKGGAKGAVRAHAPAADKSALMSTVGLKLIGSNTKAEVAGVDPLPGKSNYFVGNDPAKWHTDVPTYAKVRYSNVYPGVDLVYYGNQEGRLEHDFVVAPGADPNAIAIELNGSDVAVPDQEGGLTLHTKSADLTLHVPTVYQTIGGERKTIPAAYLLADNQIKIQLGSYDRNTTLVIDPVLQYSAVFGGTNATYTTAIAVDGAGNAYVTGQSDAVDFPLVHPFQTAATGASAFVSKLNASGTALIYSTYLGGVEAYSNGNGIAVDSSGRAYVAGVCSGSGFPVKNAYQSEPGGGYNPFLTVFSPAGDSLVYSTLLGGPYNSYGLALALDAAQNAYVMGSYDNGFLATHNPHTTGAGVFVAKFNNVGALQYSTTFGSSSTIPNAIAIDGAGSPYVAGFTVNFASAFVTKLNPAGTQVVYSASLKSSTQISGETIAVNSSGEAYIAGETGPGLPVTKNAFQKTFGGGGFDGYIAKLNSTGSAVVYATYLGGSGYDDINRLVLDQYRQVYVTGYTESPNFPLKASLQTNPNSAPQRFVSTLTAPLDSIVYYSTYFGPGGDGRAPAGIAVDKSLNVYLLVTGFPDGSIPVTPGALNIPGPALNVYVSKFVIMDDLALGLSGTPSPVLHGGNLTYTIAVTSKGPDFGYNVRVADTLPAGTTFVSYGAGGGTCTAPLVGGTGTLNCTLPQLNKGATWNVTLTVNVNAASGTNLSNTAAAISNMQDFVPANNSGTLTTHVN